MAVPNKVRLVRTGQGVALIILLIIASVYVARAFHMIEAPGETVFEKSGLVLDASNADQGYVMVKHSGSKKKLKFRVTKGKKDYTYDLKSNGEYVAIPLQMGNGSYKFQLFENTSGKKYSTKFTQDIKVTVEDDNLPFLYPNVFVVYNQGTETVATAAEICKDAQSDTDKIDIIYEYVKSHIVYDYYKASQVAGGDITSYVPDVDEILKSKMGICFDYSAVMACMLRSQDVPTRMVHGYADKIYHAWNEILVDGKWVRYDATFAAAGATAKKYTDNYIY